jgi:endo-1,4-beta-D-glucanase Y
MRGWRQLAAVLLALPGIAGAASCGTWPAWEQFARSFISADGRVVDPSTPRQHTVSEAQAYGLFFALVGNDRPRFDRLLQWTENNLSRGDLTTHLPAWHWGRRDDGSWGVLDPNPASDADLWIAYTLAEAGRLWNERRYRVLSAVLARRILEQEVAELPGLGMTLLPAPVGFVSDAGWRLNPSYVPLMLLRGLDAAHPQQHWQRLIESSVRMTVEPAAKGFAPDWVLWRRDGGFAADAQTSAVGSYDAIRVYLWAGMLDADDPQRAMLIEALTPMLAATRVAQGVPPERVDTRSAVASGAGPFGFSAALLPMAAADPALAKQLARRVADGAKAAPDHYYNQVLRLFGEGWHEQRYRFDADGHVGPAWLRRCHGKGAR